MAVDFDPNLANVFEGEITELIINETPPFPTTRNHVIDPSEDLRIKVRWETFGLFGINLPDAHDNNGGAWQVKVFAESIGPGTDSELATATVQVNTRAACAVHGGAQPCGLWEAEIVVPAPVPLNENDPGNDSGVYKLVTTVFLNDNTGSQTDIIGFREGPLIQVEDPE